MISKISGPQKFLAVSASSLLALGWYTSTAAILTGTAGEAASVLGAVAIAAFLPGLLIKRKPKIDRNRAQNAIVQQLDLLKLHTMVNVVDRQDRLVEVNDVFLQTLGYRRDDLIGKSVALIHDQNSGPVISEIGDGLAVGRGWEGETALRKKDGSVCFTQTTITPLHDTDGNWIGSISARTDITKATQLLAERDTALTLHELRDDVWIIDGTTGVFKYMNRIAKRRFGWNIESYQRLTIGQMTEDRDCGEILEFCQELKASNRGFGSREIRAFGKTFELSVKWLNGGTVDSRFLIMMHDISDRLAQQRQQADFISMVSHELRSPLTSIKGSMGLLLSKAAGDLPPRAEALLEISHRNADRLVLIINDILDLEKISSGRMEFEINQCNISEMVQEVLRANAGLLQRFNLKIRNRGTDAPVFIETDANRVIQVLTNLLSNAAKFSESGGTIDISVEQDHSGVRVSVSDQGAGIPLKDQHKIFQRFADMANSDRSAKGGTGLGLSICKAIVDSLGGRINFGTAEGWGTTFTFTLPEKQTNVVPIDAQLALRNAG